MKKNSRSSAVDEFQELDVIWEVKKLRRDNSESRPQIYTFSSVCLQSESSFLSLGKLNPSVAGRN